MWSLTVGVIGILVTAIGAGCVTASRSPLAEQVRVCGKLYKPEPSVVVVREEPQWLAVSDEDCAGASLVSPQPKSSGRGGTELSKALGVASSRLKELPRFGSPGVNTAESVKGNALVGGTPGRSSAAVPSVKDLQNGGTPSMAK
jgi:hypothetical protein